MEVKGNSNYIVYDSGHIYSKKRDDFVKWIDDGHGYHYVDLMIYGKRKCYKVHRLVAEHFLEYPNDGKYYEVDHKDRNKKNNNVSNLRWITREEQSQNRGNFKNNTSGHKNVFISKSGDRFIFRKQINHKHYQKTFKNYEECVEYAKNFKP